MQSAVQFANAYSKKPVTEDDLLRSSAWALAKWIAKHGTRPHPFFAPAVEKNRADIESAISESVKEEL